MKCLSVVQPWASLIVRGAKRFETRSWCTSHRGLLAIHAARTFPEPARALCGEEPFRSILADMGVKSWFDLPSAAVLGTVRLVDCVPAREEMRFSALDLALGDFRRGRWAWKMTEPVALPQPLRLAGRLGVYDIPDLESAVISPGCTG